LPKNDPFLLDSTAQVIEVIKTLFKAPLTISKILNEYSYLLGIDIKKFKADYKNNDYPVSKYKEDLE
jgi:hypothetical protein